MGSSKREKTATETATETVAEKAEHYLAIYVTFDISDGMP